MIDRLPEMPFVDEAPNQPVLAFFRSQFPITEDVGGQRVTRDRFAIPSTQSDAYPRAALARLQIGYLVSEVAKGLYLDQGTLLLRPIHFPHIDKDEAPGSYWGILRVVFDTEQGARRDRALSLARLTLASALKEPATAEILQLGGAQSEVLYVTPDIQGELAVPPDLLLDVATRGTGVPISLPIP